MAKFMTPLRLQLNDDEKSWTLLSDLIYVSDINIDGYYTIKVPEGFVTDLASVPRLPFAYWLAGGKAHKAAVVHDWLYESATGSKEQADKVFFEAMTALGLNIRRYPMYFGVWAFGRGNYNKKLESGPDFTYRVDG